MPGDAPALTLNEIYRHLKLRLVRGGFPAPNQRGTDTVGHFAFSLNAGRYAGTVRREPPLHPGHCLLCRHRGRDGVGSLEGERSDASDLSAGCGRIGTKWAACDPAAHQTDLLPLGHAAEHAVLHFPRAGLRV
jgi:hypothetical protein